MFFTGGGKNYFFGTGERISKKAPEKKIFITEFFC